MNAIHTRMRGKLDEQGCTCSPTLTDDDGLFTITHDDDCQIIHRKQAEYDARFQPEGGPTE